MQERKSKVTIVIPNYNGREYLQMLLPSIVNQTYSEYDVIIIDDCSPDRAAVEYIKEFIAARENMQLVENRGNLGFVRTCNKGFKLATGDYVCLLTNDTEVKPNFLERNVAVMDGDSSIGVLSCIIADQDGNNWFSGGIFRAGHRVNLTDDFHGVRRVDWVAGTAPFYRREVFDAVGFLSEDFVMYHEDIDFCLRVAEKSNYKICALSDKLVTHHLWRLTPGRPNLRKASRIAYYGHRNHILLLKKYSPKHIPKILLYSVGDIVILVAVPARRMQPRDFLLSLVMTVLVIGGTLVGLLHRPIR